MGPRLFSRGNIGRRRDCDHASCRFNGATTFQPWKSASLAIFSSQTATLQWGHDFSAVEMWILRIAGVEEECFNGATTFQPWKYVLQRHAKLFGHRFNGATTFQPWKYMIMMFGAGGLIGLQWGHDFSAVEMHRMGDEHLGDVLASMGPRLFSRGNFEWSPKLENWRIGFNGATTFQPWKSFIRAKNGKGY